MDEITLESRNLAESRGISLWAYKVTSGENWCEVLHGCLIINPEGTAKEVINKV